MSSATLKKIGKITHHILAIIGGISLILLVFYGISTTQNSRLNQSAELFTDEVIKSAVTNWNYEAFNKIASPEFFSAMNEEAAKNLFSKFSELGSLQSSQGCRGQAGNMNLTNQVRTGADFICNLKFEKDFATLRLTLLWDETNKKWGVAGINVSSNALFSNPQL